MPRGNAIGWSQSEADNLLPWLSRNEKLSWEAKSRAYFRQYRLVRTVESLRGKKYQILRKQLGRQRISASSRARRSWRQYQLRREPRELPESPPILRLGDSDPELWERVQRLQISLDIRYMRSSPSPHSPRGRILGFCPGDYAYKAHSITRSRHTSASCPSFWTSSIGPVNLGLHTPSSFRCDRGVSFALDEFDKQRLLNIISIYCTISAVSRYSN
jgi:hypothetical protein